MRHTGSLLIALLVVALLGLTQQPKIASAAPPACPDASGSAVEDSGANPITLPGCTDPDLLQIVTCALNTPPASGSATVNPTCLLATYTPNANFCGSDSFTYIGTDNGVPTSSDIGLVTVTVSCLPDAPTCSGTTVTTNEDTASTPFLLNCIDADNEPLTCAVTTQGVRGTVSVTDCGSATYTPNPDENGSDLFSYTATDGTLTSLPATGSVTITAVNDTPSCPDASSTVLEDSASSPIALLGCTDVDLLQTVNCALDSGPANGSATVDTSCLAATYTPNINFCGSDSFSYIGTDNGVPPFSDTGVVSVTVTCVPDVPSCSGVTVTTNEDSASAPFSLNCSDADSEPLTCAITTQGVRGTVSITNCGSAVYTPNPNENGSDLFSYTATDGTLTSVPATGSVTITGVNDPPSCPDASTTVLEDSASNPIALLGCTDVDLLQTVSCALGSGSANGSATVDASCLAAMYTPNANFCGSDSFSYVGTDDGVPPLSDSGTVSVTVTCVPDAPVCSGTSVTTAEDTTSPFFSLNCTDADGSLPICSIVTQGAKGTVSISSCLFATYTPNPNQTGPDIFTYQASDGLLTSAPATGVVTIGAIDDDSPSCPDVSATVLEDSISNAIVVGGCTDPDLLQIVTCAQATSPLNGTASVNPTCLAATYTPNANFCGTDSFIYTGTDNGVPPRSDSAMISITVTCIPDAPICSGTSVATQEDTTSAPFSLNCSDPDGVTPLTCAMVTQGAQGTVNLAGCFGVYTPNANATGPDAFTYTASDGTLTSVPAVGTVAITPVDDDPPACPNAAAVVVEDSGINPIVLSGCSDPDLGQIVTCSLAVAPAGGSATVDSSCLAATYSPNPNFCGNDSFTYTGTDNGVPPRSDAGLVTITMTCLPDAPSCSGTSVTTDEDIVSPVFSLNCSDPDGPPEVVTCSVLFQGMKGAVTVTSCPVATYMPDPNQNGPDSFTYTATDGALTSVPATGNVTINPINDPPVCPDGGPITVAEDSGGNSTVLPSCTDPVENNVPITCSLGGAPAHGSVTVHPGCTAVYSPTPNYCGTDSFIYSGTDSGAPPAADSGVISIIITCDMDGDDDGVNDADEVNCGGDPVDTMLRPERVDGPFAGVDDDGDMLIDEPLPAGAANFDCDGDGYSGTTENHVYNSSGGRDQDACGMTGWPAELDAAGPSAGRISLTDLSSFIAPMSTRVLGTSPGDPNYDVRWDLVPGAPNPALDHINLTDLANVILLKPPMLSNMKAFGGLDCPWAP